MVPEMPSPEAPSARMSRARQLTVVAVAAVIASVNVLGGLACMDRQRADYRSLRIPAVKLLSSSTANP